MGLQGRVITAAALPIPSYVWHMCCALRWRADLGGKDAVLRLVGHADPGVQKQALLASQKVLLSKSKADYLTHLVRPVHTYEDLPAAS
jgi:hypothetical protein